MDLWFPKGLEGFADGTHDFDTFTYKGAALAANSFTDTCVKAVTGATNANPAVITINGHGWNNGDIVLLGKIGGNLSCNGLFTIANQATNTIEGRTITNGLTLVGSGAYTTGGYAINVSLLDNLDDFDACRVGTDQTLASKTVTNGFLDAANLTWTAISGNEIQIVSFFKDTGTPSTSRAALLIDGRQMVEVAADAASSATSIWVKPLRAAIDNGTAIHFSNGIIATLTAAPAAGARQITVSAISGAIAAGHQSDVAYTNSRLPFTPNGGDLNLNFDTLGIARL